jgi:hypothetical protein
MRTRALRYQPTCPFGSSCSPCDDSNDASISNFRILIVPYEAAALATPLECASVACRNLGQSCYEGKTGMEIGKDRGSSRLAFVRLT